MTDKVYFLSNDFDYSKLIARDAGPGYAESFGWPQAHLRDMARFQAAVNIIDNRLTAAECAALEAYITSHPRTLFLLKVVDPYYEWCQTHWYYQFLFRVKDLAQVFFLTPYWPREVVQDLDLATLQQKMVWIPYPFDDQFALPQVQTERRRKIVFSGNQHPQVYPYRYRFRRAVKRNPLLWSALHTLPHPGYADIGQQHRHQVIGAQYLDYLSGFRFMFVSPSRCGLEFLKYGECAYAACVPVGKAPDSFSARVKEFFVELDFDRIGQSVGRLLTMSETEVEQRAAGYRQVLWQERRADDWNAYLDGFLARVVG